MITACDFHYGVWKMLGTPPRQDAVLDRGCIKKNIDGMIYMAAWNYDKKLFMTKAEFGNERVIAFIDHNKKESEHEWKIAPSTMAKVKLRLMF